MADEKDASERLAEQQAKFNAEALKSEQILSSLSSILGTSVNSLASSSQKVRDLNTALGQGVDITTKLNKQILDSGKRVEELEFQRQVNLAKFASARSESEKISALSANRKIDAELSIENKLRSQLQLLDDHLRSEKAITEEEDKQNNLREIGKKKLKDLKKTFTEMLTGAAVFDMIWKGLTRANEVSVDISKNFGYSAMKADVMVMEMQAMADASGQTNMTLKNMAEASGQIAQTTGYITDYSRMNAGQAQDILGTQIMLTKQLGLSGEEAAHIYEMSVLTGKSSSQVNDEMLGAFVNARNTAKVGVSMKQAFAEAAKVSGQLQANFAGNPAKIVEAIVKVKALGTTLEQTKNQGEKLLDFASSLESELNAELLTGKQLNLERARAAALSGDQVALAEELNKNIGTYDDFSKMNVLQQKALAEAVGLTADQLAEQLKKQKLAQESGKSLAEITKEEAEKAEKRKTIQEKYNNIVEKLQDIIGSIGTFLAPIIEGFTFLADQSWLIYTALGIMLLSKMPSLVKGFKDIGSSMMDTGKGAKDTVKKLFTKGGLKSMLTGDGAKDAAQKTTDDGNKVKETAEKTSKSGEKAGTNAGKSIKETLKGISAGIKSFSEVSFKDIAKLALSAVALVLLTPAIPALLLLQMVNGKLIKGALLGIGQGLAAMGKAVAGALPEILIMELLLAGLGLALWAFVPIVEAFVPIIQAFGDVILKVFTGIGIVIKAAADGISTLFTSLGNVNVAQLMLVGPALISVGLGLAALGGGGVISAIGAFLGGDPIAKIERLAAAGSGLQAASTGLQGVATALTQVALALAAIDVSKLEALSSFSEKNSSSDSIISTILSPIKAVGSMVEGGGGGNDNTAMITAINEVRDAVNKLYTKDTSIHMDGKKVGTTLSQGSYKVA